MSSINLSTMSEAELRAYAAKLTADNEALKAKRAEGRTTHEIGEGLGCKVSEKGAVSVYGLSRFPITLYGSQWLRLFPAMAALEAFIKANGGTLKEKPAKVPAPVKA